jgi:hypothetical protein
MYTVAQTHKFMRKRANTALTRKIANENRATAGMFIRVNIQKPSSCDRRAKFIQGADTYAF